jgi:hypothetical protein
MLHIPVNPVVAGLWGYMRISLSFSFLGCPPSYARPLRLWLRVLLCPLPRRCDGRRLVLLPALGDIGSEGVIGVGGAEEGLDREQNRPDLQRRRPVVCVLV